MFNKLLCGHNNYIQKRDHFIGQTNPCSKDLSQALANCNRGITQKHFKQDLWSIITLQCKLFDVSYATSKN